MKILVIGEIDEDGYFDDLIFARCMAEIAEDKDDHCGRRSIIDGSPIKSVVVPGAFAPLQIRSWSNSRRIDMFILKDDGDFYSMLVKGMGFLEAGDAVVAFFNDENDRRLKNIEVSANKARRKIYKFSLSEQRGWSLIQESYTPHQPSLF
jgi:hypothetical protein